jgi:hypothetical protein
MGFGSEIDIWKSAAFPRASVAALRDSGQSGSTGKVKT